MTTSLRDLLPAETENRNELGWIPDSTKFPWFDERKVASRLVPVAVGCSRHNKLVCHQGQARGKR
jgi:hypothetical protein